MKLRPSCLHPSACTIRKVVNHQTYSIRKYVRHAIKDAQTHSGNSPPKNTISRAHRSKGLSAPPHDCPCPYPDRRARGCVVLSAKCWLVLRSEWIEIYQCDTNIWLSLELTLEQTWAETLACWKNCHNTWLRYIYFFWKRLRKVYYAVS